MHDTWTGTGDDARTGSPDRGGAHAGPAWGPAPHAMRVTIREEGQALVVSVTGELDAGTAALLRDRIGEHAAAAGRHVVLDLSGVEFIDSTGLGTVVRARKALRVAGTTMSLVVATTPVRRVLEMAGLVGVLDVHPTLAAALADVRDDVRPASSPR